MSTTSYEYFTTEFAEKHPGSFGDNLHDAEVFLPWLYRGLAPEYWTTLGTLVGNGSMRFDPYSIAQLPDMTRRVISLNGTSQAWQRICPMAVTPPVGHRGKKEASVGSMVVWVELDQGRKGLTLAEMYRALFNFRIPPSAIIFSGHGFHAYWGLRKFCTDITLIESINRGLVQELAEFGADPAAVDAARVLRTPGTVNRKDPDHPIDVRLLLFCPDRLYDANIFPKSIPDGDENVDYSLDEEPLPDDFETEVRQQKLYPGLWDRMTTGKGAKVKENGEYERSDTDHYVISSLLALGYSKGVCFSVMTHRDWFVGSKARQRGIDYVRRTVSQAYNKYMKKTDRFFLGKTFAPARMGRELASHNAYLAVAGLVSELKVYTSGVYRQGDVRLKQEIQNLLGDRWTKGRSEEVVNWVATFTAYAPPEKRTSLSQVLVNVRNGMLRVDADSVELLPHSPTYKSMVQLPMDYIEDIDTTEMETFLSQVVDEGKTTYEEFLGYCLTPGYWLKKAALFIGGGDNGKSKLLGLTDAFLGGSEQVSKRTLHDLAGGNRFAGADLFNKLANIFADLPDGIVEDIGGLKTLTGDDPISAERKFSNAFSFYNSAKLLFSANRYPRVMRPDSAFFNRWIIIKCPNTFKDDPELVDEDARIFLADPNILDRLTTPENLSALLKLAIAGLQRLLRNKRFTESETSRRALHEFMIQANTALGFWNSQTEIDPKHSAQLPREVWYRHYYDWCISLNVTPGSDKAFYAATRDALDSLGLLSVERTTHPGHPGLANVFRGRKLKQEK